MHQLTNRDRYIAAITLGPLWNDVCEHLIGNEWCSLREVREVITSYGWRLQDLNNILLIATELDRIKQRGRYNSFSGVDTREVGLIDDAVAPFVLEHVIQVTRLPR